MKKWHADHGYLLCPHSAVGVHAADKLGMLKEGRTVCLATAHPAKFPEATDRLGLEGVSETHEKTFLIYTQTCPYSLIHKRIINIYKTTGDSQGAGLVGRLTHAFGASAK